MMIAEIPIVFGTYNLSKAIAPSAGEAEASRYIQGTPSETYSDSSRSYEYFLGAWVAFAKNPQNGLSKHGWPQFSFDRQSL
jgi:hypothetical protein